MAIAPPSDIVLDVARAADPLRYDAAVRKLTAGAIPGDAGIAFTSLLEDASSAIASATEPAPAEAVAAKRESPVLADLRGRLDPFEHLAERSTGVEPYKKFEAFVLQSFVQSMFPKEASNVFGSGIAGEYWSSMLAEQIANQVAEAGGVGIAAQIASSHPGGQARGEAGGQMGELRHFERPQAGRVLDALAALPGYVTSLELAFADKVMPGAADRNEPGQEEG